MIGSAVSDPPEPATRAPPTPGAPSPGRSPPGGVGQAPGALEQAAVQIEDVSGIGLAARGTAQQERDLAVGPGVFRQIIVDDAGVAALLGELLPDGAAGVGGDILPR